MTLNTYDFVVRTALAAGLGVAFLPAVLTGPGTDLTSSLQLGSASLGAILPILFLAGVLTSLTPCVYPLIPITVNCYGQHAIARRGGLARFAEIEDEKLDPVGPSPARCFALGRAVAQSFVDTDQIGRAHV